MVVCSSTRNGRDGITVLPLSTSSSARLNEPALASYSIRWAWSAHLALWRVQTCGGVRGFENSGCAFHLSLEQPLTPTLSRKGRGGRIERAAISPLPLRERVGVRGRATQTRSRPRRRRARLHRHRGRAAATAPQRPAAIDRDERAGDVAGARRGEEERELRHVVEPAEAPQRQALHHRLARLGRAQPLEALGALDRAGRDRVDADAV